MEYNIAYDVSNSRISSQLQQPTDYDYVDPEATNESGTNQKTVEQTNVKLDQKKPKTNKQKHGFVVFTTLLALFISITAIILGVGVLLQSSNSNQSLMQELNKLKDNLTQQDQFLREQIQTFLPGRLNNPVSSCKDVPTDSPTGEYWIRNNITLPPVQVHCDMNPRSCSCNTTGGWMIVANLDMTDPSQQCPNGFRQVTRATEPLRTCGRPGEGCVSTTFPVHGIEYSRVCGKVISYQVGSPDSFHSYRNGIDGQYIDGVSLTHGQSPRQHIWTFVGAAKERLSSNSGRAVCPCNSNGVFTGTVPSFINQDYFCDTALRENQSWVDGTLYPDDPLWDGQGCGGTSTCCEFNNPPWFCKQLPQATTDDIELRICNNEGINDDTPFEIVEVYIN